MLTRRDVRTVGDVLTQCHDAPDIDAYAQRVLTGIARLVPSTYSSFNLWDPRRRRITWVEHPRGGAAFPGAQDALSAHFPEHPVLRHFSRNPGEPGFVKISDFMTDRQFARTAIYNEYYRKRGVRHQLSVMLPAGPPGSRIAIALNRDRPDFTERDRMLLNLLPAHLLAAYRHVASFAEVSSALALIDRGLDAAGVGLVVLAGGEPVLTTAWASQLLDAYFGKSTGRGLPDRVRRWLAGQEPVPAGRVPATNPLLVNHGSRQLSIRLARDGARRVLLLEERTENISPQCLVRLGLSGRQAEVLRWVALGKTDAEVATILGLSARTVHHHLEQVYHKLSVENRTAAARIAFEAAER